MNLESLAQEEIERWRLGDYTSQGYLAALIEILGEEEWSRQTRNISEFCEKYSIGERSFYRAMETLSAQERIERNPKASLEKQIRDSLHQQLGGLIEVATPVGRIDLLTESEVIEVKAVQDWKSALGQVLAYAGFYPEHQKRIHLFGKTSASLRTAKETCTGFGVTVTFEEVQDDAH